MTGRQLSTKELSARTWADYVRFFSQGNGWDHCGCTAYHGFRPPRDVRKWSEKRDWNLGVKCELVERGRTFGILVYAGAEPVGWCQYGPAYHFPLREDHPRRPLFKDGEERKWCITCFCTRPDVAQTGVAGVALRGALRSIARRGGGLVEAYPMAHVPGDWKSDERLVRNHEWLVAFHRLLRVHGKDSDEVRRHIAEAPPEIRIVPFADTLAAHVPGIDLGGGREVVVDGIGPVYATYWGRFHGGTVAMFEREGFRACEVLPVSKRVRRPGPFPARVVMQRTI